MTLRFGCQTYTWQMSYDTYKDQLLHILDVIRLSGFQGVEAEVCMMGPFYRDSALLAEALATRNLQLAALTLALPWLCAGETGEERREAEYVLNYIQSFPEAKLVLVQLPGADRSQLAERQQHCLRCVNAVAQRAHERGIVCAFHPNSPQGSVFRTAEDYEVMFAGLDTRYVGYCPDSGHIANGGMDVMDTFKSVRPIITHVHCKDISSDGRWESMGNGKIDHPGLIAYLRQTGYDGWMMVEEESARAETEPDAVTIENGEYIKRFAIREEAGQ